VTEDEDAHQWTVQVNESYDLTDPVLGRHEVPSEVMLIGDVLRQMHLRTCGDRRAH
jgi:hypothetical protein